MMADVCGMPMKVYDNKETCALGAAMCGATVAGIYPTIQAAQEALMAGVKCTFIPNAAVKAYFDRRYSRYLAATRFTEENC